MKQLQWAAWVLAGTLSLAGCSEEMVKPQGELAQVEHDTAGESTQPAVPQHNLSRVAKANPVSREQLEALTVGQTRQAEVTALLGEIEPFTLGGGKQILRYDVGKFIFDKDGVLIRKFLND